MTDEEESFFRLEGTIRYLKAVYNTLTRIEVIGLERDMILLLAQVKRGGIR